jgi:hypothetical protein
MIPGLSGAKKGIMEMVRVHGSKNRTRLKGFGTAIGM